jgi:predicted phosphodiesterase
MFNPQFQILSDIHLETPLPQPTYKHFSRRETFPLLASNLFLLGDIGYVRDEALFTFLRSLLRCTPNLKIFYVLGNHEAYGITLSATISTLESFEIESRREFGERFFFMHRRRVDFSPTLTILGCTLWTRIPHDQAAVCARLLTDFNEATGIKDRTVDLHNEDHHCDLAWLDAEIRNLESEPQRSVMVLTHHSPTADPRANDPKRESQDPERDVTSGFVTDLRVWRSWSSEQLKVWAFGHTHFSCAYTEEGTAKLVVSSQKGYCGLDGQGNWEVPGCVIEEDVNGTWKIVDTSEEGGENGRKAQKPELENIDRGISSPNTDARKSRSVFGKVGAKVKTKFGIGHQRHQLSDS